MLGWQGQNMIDEANSPACSRIDRQHEVRNHDQEVVNLSGWLMLCRAILSGDGFRNDLPMESFDIRQQQREAAVPQTAVMRTDVPHRGQGVQYLFKDFDGRHAKPFGNFPFYIVVIGAFEPAGQAAKAQSLDHCPYRGKVGFVIIFPVMGDEGFAAVSKFGGNAREILHMIPGILEQFRVHVRMAPVAQRHGACPSGAYRDLDPLDGLHDEKPQLSVEYVQAQYLLEGRVRLESMISRW